jgi:hypothetical protein
VVMGWLLLCGTTNSVLARSRVRSISMSVDAACSWQVCADAFGWKGPVVEEEA